MDENKPLAISDQNPTELNGVNSGASVAAVSDKPMISGYSSVLQAVHARLGCCARNLPSSDGKQAGTTPKAPRDTAPNSMTLTLRCTLRACRGMQNCWQSSCLLPAKSLDRSIIAATARRHHTIVEYMLCLRELAEEAVEKDNGEQDATAQDIHSNIEKSKSSLKKSPELTELLSYKSTTSGMQVSQSAIDRALVRAAAIELVDEDFERRKLEKAMRVGGNTTKGLSQEPPPLPLSLPALKRARDSAFRRLMSVATVPAMDRAFCSVAASGGGKDKARMLLPSVSLRGRRSGLLRQRPLEMAVHLTLCAILEADAASNKEQLTVRAKLGKARFATTRDEGAAARGHESVAYSSGSYAMRRLRRALAAAELNGHHSLIDLMKGGTELARYDGRAVCCCLEIVQIADGT